MKKVICMIALAAISFGKVYAVVTPNQQDTTKVKKTDTSTIKIKKPDTTKVKKKM